jgi:histidyl-tRNA synthetase
MATQLQHLNRGVTAMITRTEDRTPYLTLALDARKIVNGLLQYINHGDLRPNVQTYVGTLVNSLNALSTEGNLFDHLQQPSFFEHFEQIRTLVEVRKSVHDDHLIEKLQNFLNADPGNAATRAEAKDVLKFISALEARALQRYNQGFGSGSK